MNYSETVLFVAKCLTISSNEKNKIEVKKVIEDKTFDWDSIVRVSTSHFVFPALYLNLKYAELLKQLPNDLCNYMEHITNLNRERNLSILKQVKDINRLLLKHDIEPIFLKGASFIVEELYIDISERMIGDIDFIVKGSQFKEAVLILKKYGYNSVTKEDKTFLPSKHYPRLVRKGSIAAIEVHKSVISNKYSEKYNYTFFLKKNREIENIKIPSIDNQIIHNCINKQFGDNGKQYKSFSLRNSYDLFKLSFKGFPLDAINKEIKYFKIFNNYLANSYFLFKHENLSYKKSRKALMSLKISIFLLENPIFYKINKIFHSTFLNFEIKFKKTIKLLFKKEYRNYYLYRYFK